ncbi:hypothetical protein [Amycolatopsis anabasis]|uniref:aggregation-promoting factor C-terminal-like domain-containing protein n=1 Tax=Amycolatopsis anabasis TaxID=1840409 RepID=UPI00131E640F|nr:hypothetical protein [Amycolatopsis anabasis]
MAESGEAYWVEVLPSARRWGTMLAKEASGAGKRAGDQLAKELDAASAKAGQSAGRNLSDGLAAAEAEVKKIGTQLQAARDKEADAAGRVRVAEQQLNEVRANSNARASQVAAAEERLAAAQRNHAATQQRVTTVTEDYERAQRNATEATEAIKVSGEDSSVAMDKLSKALHSVDDVNLRRAHKSMIGFGAGAYSAAAAVSLLGHAALGMSGFASAIGTASGAALILPGAAFAGAAAVGTLALGVNGLGDAMKAVAEGDAKKLDEALKGMAPSAAAVVRELAALKPQFDAMQDAVQQRLFEGVSAQLRPLANQYLPMANRELTVMAAGYNAAALQAIAFVREARTVNDVNAMLGNSNTAMRELGTATVNLLPAFRDIAAVGSEFLPNLTGGAALAARSFSDMIARMRESGQLQQIMINGLSLLGDIAIVAGNLGSILASVFHAGATAGGSFLDTLKFLSGELAAFLKTPEGSAALLTFFTTVHDVVVGLSPGLRAVLGALAQGVVILGPSVPPLANAFSAVAVALAPLLVDAAYLAADLIPKLAAGVQFLAPALGPLLAAFGAGVLAMRAWSLAMRGMMFVSTVVSVVQALTTAQHGLNAAMRANVIGLIVTAIAALVAGFLYLWNHSAGFRDFWIGIWEAIKAAVLFAWQSILKPAFDGIVAALRFLGDIATWLWVTVLQPTFSFIGQAAGILAAILTTVLIGPSVLAFQALAAVATWLWDTVLQPVFSALGAFFGWLWNTLLKPYFDAWVFVFTLIGNGAMWLWANALQPAFSAIGSFLGWVWNTLLKPYFDGWLFVMRLVGDAATWLWDHAIRPAWDAITGALSWAYDNVIKPVFGWFKDRIDDAKRGFELLQETTKRVFDTIVGFIKPPIQFVIDVVWNNGLRRVYNAAAALIPGVNELPELRLARGGVIPGYAPGRDTVPALLSPGEAVLVPELVRVIGPATILAANAAAMSGRAYSRGGLVGRFAEGGIVGPATGTAGAAAATTATATNPAASTAATEALNVASAALAETVNTVLIPAVLVLEQHTGVLLPQANTQLGMSLATLQLNAMTVWTAITSHIVSSDTALTLRQWQLQADLATSWNVIAASVWGSVNAQNSAFGALHGGLAAVRDAVSFTAGWVHDRFAEMQGHAARPVSWILAWPVNAGLVAAWNKLNADFSLGKFVPPVPIPFASGGPVPGSGNTDKIAALLTPGEYVLPKRVVEAWGVGNIRAAHVAALHGNFPGLEGLLGDDIHRAQVVPGYQSGGLVADTGSAMNAAIARVVQFGRSMHGRPYVWGGSSTAGTDCSGWQAMLKRAALDQQPYDRREWATGGVSPGSPPPGFVSGINGTFAIGVSHGHTAGTIAGINAESGGSHGYVAFGPPSAGADHPQFPMHFHIAELGGQFVSGGGGFDPRAIVDAAFANTYRMVDDVTRFFPGNIAAQHGQGITRQAADRVKEYAVGKLTELYASTALGAGSPEVVAAVRAVATRYGWGSGPQWDALSWLIGHESGWNPAAKNPTSSARGLFQKMESVHGPVEPTAAGQAEWGLRYIASRYRDPLGAKAFWQAHHWYDEGGWLQPGYTPVYNGTGKPELVLPHDTAHNVLGALQQASEPMRIVGELSIADDGLKVYVDGRIEERDHATGTAIARGVRI